MGKTRAGITVWMPEGMVPTIDLIVGINDEYITRSEFVRTAVHLLILLEYIKDDKVVQVGPELLKQAQKAARL